MTEEMALFFFFNQQNSAAKAVVVWVWGFISVCLVLGVGKHL